MITCLVFKSTQGLKFFQYRGILGYWMEGCWGCVERTFGLSFGGAGGGGLVKGVRVLA